MTPGSAPPVLHSGLEPNATPTKLRAVSPPRSPPIPHPVQTKAASVRERDKQDKERGDSGKKPP